MMYPDIFCKQARLDRTYLYGMLASSNKKNGERKLIFKYEASQDRIMAWIKFLRVYDNNGSEEVRMNKLESLINVKYHSRYPGGFLNYIDVKKSLLPEFLYVNVYLFVDHNPQR